MKTSNQGQGHHIHNQTQQQISRIFVIKKNKMLYELYIGIYPLYSVSCESLFAYVMIACDEKLVIEERHIYMVRGRHTPKKKTVSYSYIWI